MYKFVVLLIIYTETTNEIHVLISTPRVLYTVHCSGRQRTFKRILSGEELEENICVSNSVMKNSRLHSYSREKFLAMPTLHGGLQGRNTFFNKTLSVVFRIDPKFGYNDY